jgi:hypothetical protein
MKNYYNRDYTVKSVSVDIDFNTPQQRIAFAHKQSFKSCYKSGTYSPLPPIKCKLKLFKSIIDTLAERIIDVEVYYLPMTRRNSYFTVMGDGNCLKDYLENIQYIYEYNKIIFETPEGERLFGDNNEKPIKEYTFYRDSINRWQFDSYKN